MLSLAQRRLLTCLRERSDWCLISDLAKALDLHENSVRATVNVLVARGYVERTQAHTGQRGRPSWLYRARSATDENMQLRAITAAFDKIASDPQSDLGRRVAEAVEVDCLGEDTRVGEISSILEYLRSAGFAVDPHDDNLIITFCPYREIGRKPPSAICRVHGAIISQLVRNPNSIDFLPVVRPGQCEVHFRHGRD